VIQPLVQHAARHFIFITLFVTSLALSRLFRVLHQLVQIVQAIVMFAAMEALALRVVQATDSI